MNCQQIQTNLSLYLYGELNFSEEEQLEAHLATCSLCSLALDREKAWQTALNTERRDVPLDLLSQCRRNLHVQLNSGQALGNRPPWWKTIALPAFPGPWSNRLAFASLFLLLGFGLSRVADGVNMLGGLRHTGVEQASLLSPGISRVRTVRPDSNKRVRLVVDHIQQQEITGSITDENVRLLLLQASKDPSDPGLRIDSVEMLKDQSGSDIRDALLYSVQHDENAAVRLKALEGLRNFRSDRGTRDVLRAVLENDSSPAVRTEAIDVLVPAGAATSVSSDLAQTLQTVIESEPANDYLRARCLQILSAEKPERVY